MKCCMVSSSSLHNGHNLETWNWLNFALTLWSTYDPHVSFAWAYAFNRLFELCLHCVRIGCTFPGAYNALFRNFNVDFVSASWIISLFQCSFTCRLTIIFHASFSGGLSSNTCAVGRPYLYSISRSAINQLLEVLSLTANCLRARSFSTHSFITIFPYNVSLLLWISASTGNWPDKICMALEATLSGMCRICLIRVLWYNSNFWMSYFYKFILSSQYTNLGLTYVCQIQTDT